MDYGIKVSLRGKDVTRQRDLDMSFSSKFNQWKIYKIVDKIITIPVTAAHGYSGGEEFELESMIIPHGLHYMPLYQVWAKGITDWWGQWIPMVQAPSFTEEFPYYGRTWADINNINIYGGFYNYKCAEQAAHDLYIKCFLFYENIGG